MRPLLGHPAGLHDDDVVGLVHGRQAVRDHDGGAARLEMIERVAEQRLGFGVERAGRLVEQQDLRIAQHGARDRQALPLAAGQR